MNFDLLRENFSLQYINALVQLWQNTRRFRCFGRPKRQHLLLYLQDLSIRYTDREGNRVTACSGDVVYTPAGSEYEAEIFDFKGENAHTVGINFLLFDGRGEPCSLGNEIYVFRNADPALFSLFHRAASVEEVASPLRKRILLMEALSLLTESTPKRLRYEGIEEALTYLAEHIEENPSVAFLAERCGMSQVYFRKCFRIHTGLSPVEYRSRLRLTRAAAYLEFGEIRVQEISDTLGFATVSHFIKEFKRSYGVSPLQYRRRMLELQAVLPPKK